MKKCSICKDHFALTEFNKKRGTKDGLQSVCRLCNSKRSKQYYRENHDKHVKIIRESKRLMIEANRENIYQHFLENPCVDCGETDIRVLEFDHVKGDKVMGVGSLVSRGSGWTKVQAEINKCEVRCRNCHTKKTYDRLGTTWHSKYLGSEALK